MQEYSYEALGADGQTVRGSLTGASSREVVLKLQQRGLVVLDVSADGGGAGGGAGSAVGGELPKSPPKNLAKGRSLAGSFGISGAGKSASRKVSGKVSGKVPGKKAGRISGTSASRGSLTPRGLERGKNIASRLDKLAFGPFAKVRTRDLVGFCENLAVLLEAGIPLDKSLALLAELTPKPRLRAIIADVHARVREGMALGEALAAQGGVLPPVLTGMVSAGEQGGILESVLRRLAEYLGRLQEIKEYLTSAMIYPAILSLTSAASMVVLLTFVVPRFASMFDGLGVAIPTATALLLTVGTFMRTWWWALLLGLLLAALVGRMALRTPTGRRAFDAAKLKLPLIGPITVKVEVSRLASTLGTLLENGVAILPALAMARGAVQNSILDEDLGRVYDELKEGELLSAALERIPYFPRQASQMIGVGEETGRLDALLIKVAGIYDKDLRVTVKSATALIEPLIILVMGLAIGAMVVSMLLAIFSINDVEF